MPSPKPRLLGLIRCPQSDSNRHCTDFKNVSVGYCDQRKQVAETRHIGCERAYLGVAGTDAVRLRYGSKSPPVAGVKLARAAHNLG
jgi:hypothetical protein